jgi:hypothetical protein
MWCSRRCLRAWIGVFDVFYRVTTANLCFSRPRMAYRAAAYLAHLTQGADVLLLQECRDVDVKQLLPAGWRCNQRGVAYTKAGTLTRRGRGKRGSCVAWRIESMSPPHNPTTGGSLRLGAAGAGINPRWISTQRLRGIPFRSAHWPLRKTGLQPVFTLRMRRLNRYPTVVVVGCDANTRDFQGAARRAGLPGAYNGGRGYIGLMSKGARVMNVVVDRTGVRQGWTDHPAVSANIERR